MPKPMQFTTVASVGVVASAAVDPYRPKNPKPVACSVVSEIRATKAQPPRPAALPRQQARPADRCSAAASTVTAEVRCQRRMLAARLVAANVGAKTVPTEVIGRPPVVIVVGTEDDQLAIPFTPEIRQQREVPPRGPHDVDPRSPRPVAGVDCGFA